MRYINSDGNETLNQNYAWTSFLIYWLKNDQSIYKGASMAVKYSYEGKADQAIEQLRIFSGQDNYQYWILLFMELDPIMEPLKAHPEYPKIMQQIKDRFWENQAELRSSLKEKGLL